MKKLSFLLMMVICCWIEATAQPMGIYDFKYEKVTYQDLEGGTVVPFTLESETFNNVVFDGSNNVNTGNFSIKGYPIGFDFKFDNKKMNQFAIASNGYILLGRDKIEGATPSNISNLFSDNEHKDFIGVCTIHEVLYSDSTEISYKTSGTEGNKVLTIQYKNLVFKTKMGGKIVAVTNLQYQLYENTGEVRMCFNNWQQIKGQEANGSTVIGIKGFIEKDLLVISQNFNKPVASASKKNIIWSSKNWPEDGMQYSFFPPEECTKPVSQPTDLVLKSGSNSVEGSFNADPESDYYLVLISENENLKELPQDNVYYAKGDTLGNAVVLSFSSNTTFASEQNLNTSSSYYVSVFSVNSKCLLGPKYNTENPLKGKINTLSERPSALVIDEIEKNYITLDVVANAKNQDVLIGIETVTGKDRFGNMQLDGMFGQPTGFESVGDSITGGGIVVYKGTAKNGIKIDNLKENTLYHFMAWSINEEGLVSTNNITANNVTASSLPWLPDFTSHANNKAPIGWNCKGTWIKDKDNILEVNLMCPNPAKGDTAYIETPYLYMSNLDNRVMFDITMTQYLQDQRETKPYKMSDTDTLRVQVSEDGINYADVFEITGKNGPKPETLTDYTKYYVPFTGFAGKKVKIRFSLVVHTAIKAYFKNIMVEEKADCDYPIDLAIDKSKISSESLGFTWTARSEEKLWEIVYKENEKEEWSEPLYSKTNSCLIEGLSSQTIYDIKVRATRSSEEKSRWSDILTFKSPIAVPFNMVFSEEYDMPTGWSIYSAKFGEEHTESANWSISKSVRGNINVKLNVFNTDPVNDWIETPKFYIHDEYVKHILKLEMREKKHTDDKNIKIDVVIARGDEPFKAENVIYTITEDDFNGTNVSNFEKVLTGYKGLVRLGLYLHGENAKGFQFLLTKMSLEYSCVNDIKTSISDITETSAIAEWEGSSEEVLYFCRENGSQEKNYTKTSEKKIALQNLESHTLYEFGITKVCEPGDTALVNIEKFLTLGNACETVKNVKVVPQKYSATISWTPVGYAYNVKYRKTGTSEWFKENTKDSMIVITDLEDKTSYDYTIQTMGSELENDTSEYTPVAQFTTLEETCFFPENIVIEPSYFRTNVSWDANGSTSYLVGYKKEDSEEWIVKETEDNKYLIEDLEAETAYNLRLRSINQNDSSKWSPILNFSTTAIPECITPSELKVTEITSNSALLSWTADSGNILWNIKYRKSSDSSWTDDVNLSENKYPLENLEPEVLYIWKVQAECADKQMSKWSSQNKFTTLTDGMREIEFSGLNVSVSDGILSIINSYEAEIKSISCYDIAGNLLVRYDVNSSDNIFVKTSIKGQVIVKIEGEGISTVKKLSIK